MSPAETREEPSASQSPRYEALRESFKGGQAGGSEDGREGVARSCLACIVECPSTKRRWFWGAVVLVERVWGRGRVVGAGPHPSTLTSEEGVAGPRSPLHFVTKSATHRQNPVNGNEGFVAR